MKINSRMSEAALASEEFTQRMSTMETKLQQVTVERDGLKEENKVFHSNPWPYDFELNMQATRLPLQSLLKCIFVISGRYAKQI